MTTFLQKVTDFGRKIFRDSGSPKPKTDNLKPADLLREWGVPTLLLDASGRVTPQYHPELKGLDWFRKVDQMRTESGFLQSLELSMGLPIEAAQWYIQEGPSQELNGLAQQALFGHGDRTFPEVLRASLLARFYGVWVFEEVYEEVDGALLWKKLADRPPNTLYQWVGNLNGIEQYGSRFDAAGNVEYVANVFVPVEKLVIFSYHKTGDEWDGTALTRPMYLHWECLRALYRIANIGLEHSLAGVPIGKLPPGWTHDDRTVMETLLKRLRQHENAYFLLPPGWDIALLQQSGTQRVEFMPYIEHHAVQMMRSVLAQFLALGDTRTGSRALGDSFTEMFLMGLEADADWVASIFNRHALRHLLRRNAPTAKEQEYPQLAHGRVGQQLRQSAVLNALAQLAQGQLVLPDANLEAHLRAELGLPEAEVLDRDGAKAPEGAKREGREGGRAVQLQDPEQESRLRLLGQQMDRQETEFQLGAMELLSRQAQALVEQARPLVERIAAGDARALPRLNGLEVPERKEYAAFIQAFLERAYEAARESVDHEIAKVPEGAKREGREGAKRKAIFATKAELLAEDHAQELKFTFVSELLNRLQAGMDVQQALADAQQAFRAQATIRLSEDLNGEGRRIAEGNDGDPTA